MYALFARRPSILIQIPWICHVHFLTSESQGRRISRHDFQQLHVVKGGRLTAPTMMLCKSVPVRAIVAKSCHLHHIFSGYKNETNIARKWSPVLGERTQEKPELRTH